MFPNEIYFNILSFCDYNTLLNLCVCCQNFKNIVYSKYFKFNNITFHYYKQRIQYLKNFISILDSNYKHVSIGNSSYIRCELFDNTLYVCKDYLYLQF